MFHTTAGSALQERAHHPNRVLNPNGRNKIQLIHTVEHHIVSTRVGPLEPLRAGSATGYGADSQVRVPGQFGSHHRSGVSGGAENQDRAHCCASGTVKAAAMSSAPPVASAMASGFQ